MTLSMCLQRRGSDFAVAQSIVLAGPESTAAPVPIGRVRRARLAPAAGSTYLQNQERGLTRARRGNAQAFRAVPCGALHLTPARTAPRSASTYEQADDLHAATLQLPDGPDHRGQ